MRRLPYFALFAAVYVFLGIFGVAVDAPLYFIIGALAVVAGAFALAIASAVDAYRRARRLKEVVLRRYQRLWVYFGVIALSIGAMEALELGARPHGACSGDTPRVFSHTYAIQSGSMQPTLVRGDIIVADTRYFCRNDPHRGDLTLFFKTGFTGGGVWMKRIIGLPGDKVQVKEGRVYINEEPAPQEWLESGISADEDGVETQRTRYVESFPDGARYVVEITNLGSKVENTPEVTVPADGYYMLGDARDDSVDSRMPREFGYIPRALIVDRPAYVVWSSDWDRIGLRLR